MHHSNLSGSTPTVSIVIPCRNELGHLQSTMDSMLAAGGLADAEIIVVDDGSQDDSAGFLTNPSSIYRDVKLIRTANMGAARSRNLGADHASGDILIFCDAHIRVPSGWIETLVSTMASPEVSTICPAIASMDRPQDAGYGCTWDSSLTFSWLPRPMGSGGYGGGSHPVAVPIAPGGCLAVKRAAFTHIGGFQHNFRIWGFDDQEFSLRLWLFGYEVYVHPDVQILHYFRPRHPYEVSFRHVDYNMLWMAFTHFNQVRFAKTVALASARAGYLDILAEVTMAEAAWEQRRNYLANRVHDDDWFMQRFGIPF